MLWLSNFSANNSNNNSLRQISLPEVISSVSFERRFINANGSQLDPSNFEAFTILLSQQLWLSMLFEGAQFNISLNFMIFTFFEYFSMSIAIKNLWDSTYHNVRIQYFLNLPQKIAGPHVQHYVLIVVLHSRNQISMAS